MKKLLLLFVFTILPLLASADAVEIDGIFYILSSKVLVAEVTENPNKYSGDIVIPEKVTYEDVEYTVTSIGEKAFYVCGQLQSISLPSTINNIKKWAFAFCGKLTTFEIPNKVTEIGEYAFIQCIALSAIDIPNSVTIINKNCFEECSSLKKVTLSSNLNEIGTGAFRDCTSLESIEIPDNVTSIGNSAFAGCNNLASVKISDNLATINGGTFKGCISLTSVVIPNSVTKIGDGSIVGGAFQNCSNLTSLTIGLGVNSIGELTFADCMNLTEVKCLAKNVPKTGVEAFKGSYPEYISLYVPEGCVEAYRSVEPWSSFKEIISIEGTKYTLSYIVDGEEYKTYELGEGDEITPEPAPSKEGYLFSGWSTIPATMPAEDLTITGSFQLITDEDVITLKDTGKGTWCSIYDLDFTDVEGIKAYTATGYDDVDKTIWLTRVFKVPAGTGIMVKGDPGEHKIPHATVKAVYASFFKGVTGSAVTINETDGDNTNYYMAGGQFKKVNGSTTISPNRAYLQLPTLVFAGTRSIDVIYEDEIDDKTGIHSAAITSDQEPGIYYNLQGQRVDNPKKGLYIKNGKKVIIK